MENLGYIAQEFSIDAEQRLPIKIEKIVSFYTLGISLYGSFKRLLKRWNVPQTLRNSFKVIFYNGIISGIDATFNSTITIEPK